MVPVDIAASAAGALIGAKDRRAVAILDAVDKGRSDSFAAVDQHRIGRGVSQQGRFAGAERHRILARHMIHDAEAFDSLGDRLHPDDRSHSRGYRIERQFESDTQRRWPAKLHLLVSPRVVGG
jgi:hypothetical protein